MKRTLFYLIMSLAFLITQGATLAGELNWQELARRPELWPAQVTVKVAMKFQGGATVQPGQKANVIEVKAEEVNLVTLDGRINFAADPDETDALAVAREAYAKLTPSQQALTYPAIVQQKNLWPYRVTITRGFSLAPGKDIQAGDQVLVKDIQPGKVDVISEKLNARFSVAMSATDLMAQARKFVEDVQAGPRLLAMQKQAEEKIAAEQKALADKTNAEGRVVAELDGKLVNSVTGKPEPLDAKTLPRYLVFCRGSSTCPITRQFTPTLVKYYNEMKPKHPEFEIIWIMTESVEDTGKYAKGMGFSWRAIDYNSTSTMPSVSQPIDGRLPQLIVMDRNGRVLANGVQNQASAALAQLDLLLKQPPTH